MRGEAQRVAVVEVASQTDGTLTEKYKPTLPRGWVLGHLDPQFNWLVETPVLLNLKDGIVESVLPRQQLVHHDG